MKSRKSALLASFTSLMLSFAMLIGCTFAWFTDSVRSGVNKIVAGNLDIEVEYSRDNGANWANLENSQSLFSGSLWEPGHTEYVTLKVVNKGTLALKYQVSVSPVSESGGINVAGQSFKLSDYLVFGTTAASTSPTTYTRETARTAAGTTQALNQAALTKSGTLLPKAAGDANYPAEYITLVVYMPETVGNDANYKTGTNAPYIDLGITVVATQLESEIDSFDNTYDKNADLTPDNGSANAIEYNYFPQIDVTGQLEIDGTEVKKGSTAGEETSVTKIDNNTSKVVLASTEKVEENTAAKLEVVVNNGGLANDQTGSLTLKVVKDDTANANFQTTNVINTTEQDSTTYQVSVECEGVVAQAPAEGKALYKVDLFIGKNRSNVKMYHSGSLMSEETTGAANTFTYNSSTGYVTMYVDSFSPFTVVYDLPAAAIGTAVYYTLADAVAAAASNSIIVLLSDTTGSGVILKEADSKSITIDLNKHTYTFDDPAVGSGGTETQGFHFEKNNTVTVKNGTLNAKSGNANVKMLIQNYCNLTLDSVTLDGSNLNGSGRYVLSNNCGNVTIKDSTITAKSDGYAFDVYGGFQSYGDVTVTVTGNSVINGQVELARSAGTPSNTNKNKLIINGGTFQNDIEAIKITSGEVEINGGTIKGSENGAGHDGKCVILVDGEKSKLTLNAGTVTATGAGSDGMYGVYVCNGGTVTSNAGTTINSHFAAIGMNNTTAPANITINGGVYTAAANPVNNNLDEGWWHYFCAPVYAASNGEILISGGTFNGYYGLSDRYSNVNQNLTISGGSFNGTKKALFVDNQTGSGSGGTRTVSITGGTFSSEPEASYVDDGYKVIANNDSTWSVLSKKPVSIGEVEYDTLQEAVNTVQSSETITLNQNVEINGIEQILGKNFSVSAKKVEQDAYGR